MHTKSVKYTMTPIVFQSTLFITIITTMTIFLDESDIDHITTIIDAQQ
jgi:hypothetical protein